MIDLAEARHILVVAAFCLIRLGACFSILPFMGGDLLPGYLKNALMLTLVSVVYPFIAPSAPAEFSISLALTITLKEVFVGLAIGFVVGIVIWTAEIVGFLIDNQRGTSMATVFDPLYGHSTSPLGALLLQLATMLFFATGGFLILLKGLFESYEFWPVFELYPKIHGSGFVFFLNQADKLMKSALLLASPFLIAIFLVDLCLGLINRFVPQLDVFFLSMPIKSGIASFLLVIYLFVFVYFIKKELIGIDGLIRSLKAVFE
jgi:type III secretion protein T